jgi:hypothetical protein
VIKFSKAPAEERLLFAVKVKHERNVTTADFMIVSGEFGKN